MREISVDEALRDFGFSGKDIEVYLAALKLGSATAQEITEKAGLNRSTTYDILRAFIEKGIASKIIKEKTTYFDVATPERLISILDEKKSKLQSVLSELKLIQELTVSKPTATIYQGKEGMKAVLEDILTTKKEIAVIAHSKIFKILEYYFPHYIKRRKEAKIFTRVIQEKSKETTEIRNKDEEQLRELREIKGLNINSSKFIYADKIAIFKLVEGEVISILIKDQTIADDERLIYELLWKSAN